MKKTDMVGIPVEIMPVKRLYLTLSDMEETKGISAIVCTMDQVKREKLRDINCLHVDFADVPGGGKDAFQEAQARKIAFFVNELPDHCRKLYICCDAGESRSPAIAAAVIRSGGLSDHQVWKNPKYHPNSYVYRLQCAAFGVRLGSWRLSKLQRMNRRALKAAIRRSRQ